MLFEKLPFPLGHFDLITGDSWLVFTLVALFLVLEGHLIDSLHVS